MGAEREGTDAGSSRKRRNPEGNDVSDGDGGSPSTPEVVDFNALHAALGELPPPSSPSNPSMSVAESLGRSSATYASSRPHAIPQTRPPAADERAEPAVIVQHDDPEDTIPIQMSTVPLAQAYPGPNANAGHPQMPNASTTHPFAPMTGPPFPVQAVPQAPVEAPPQAIPLPPPPRRPRTPTIVVRTRGPTRQQKLIVFIAMLVVFVAGGIAFLVYYRPHGINIDFNALLGTSRATAPPPPPPSVQVTATMSAPPPVNVPSASVSSLPSASASVTATATATPSSLPSASASAAAKKAPRVPRPLTPPAPAPPPVP